MTPYERFYSTELDIGHVRMYLRVMFGDETEGKRADIPSSFAARLQVLGSEDWVENRRGKAETKLRFRMKR
jgi:hypothetical protein